MSLDLDSFFLFFFLHNVGILPLPRESFLWVLFSSRSLNSAVSLLKVVLKFFFLVWELL